MYDTKQLIYMNTKTYLKIFFFFDLFLEQSYLENEQISDVVYSISILTLTETSHDNVSF